MKFPIKIGKYTITYCPFDNEYEVSRGSMRATFRTLEDALIFCAGSI